MDLQGVHLVVGHDLHIVAQEAHRDELATAVDHEAAHGVIGKVADLAARQRPVVALLGYLQQRAGAPVDAFGGGSRQLDLVAYGDGITLVAQRSIVAEGQRHVALASAARLHLGRDAEHFAAVGRKHSRHALQLGGSRGIDYARALVGNETSLGGAPLLDLGNDERFVARALRRGMPRGRDHGQQER